MWRFLTGVQPLASTIAGMTAVLLYLVVGDSAAELALGWAMPSGATLVYESQASAGRHLAVAAFALALPFALGWIVAAARGARRGAPSGLGVLAACTGIILGCAVLLFAVRILGLRSLADVSARPGDLKPMLGLGMFDYWEKWIWGAVASAIALLVVVLRRPKVSGPRTPGPA